MSAFDDYRNAIMRCKTPEGVAHVHLVATADHKGLSNHEWEQLTELAANAHSILLTGSEVF